MIRQSKEVFINSLFNLADKILGTEPYAQYYATKAQRADALFKRMGLGNTASMRKQMAGFGGFGSGHSGAMSDSTLSHGEGMAGGPVGGALGTKAVRGGRKGRIAGGEADVLGMNRPRPTRPRPKRISEEKGRANMMEAWAFSRPGVVRTPPPSRQHEVPWEAVKDQRYRQRLTYIQEREREMRRGTRTDRVPPCSCVQRPRRTRRAT